MEERRDLDNKAPIVKTYTDIEVTSIKEIISIFKEKKKFNEK